MGDFEITPAKLPFSTIWIHLMLVVAVTGAYAGWSAYVESSLRTYPLDIDGWGYLIEPLKASGQRFPSLFENSFLKKGPVIPFVFGLCFYAAPFDQSIIVLNVVAFSFAAGCLFWGFCRLGASRASAFVAICLWLVYLQTHRYVFAYYYTEPLVSLLSAILFALVAYAATERSLVGALVSGCAAGVLLLARPPYLVVVGGLPLVFWRQMGGRSKPFIGSFVLGLGLVFAPWVTRNLVVYGEFIPFTTEGSLVLFQGTYLPGDSMVINDLRKVPEFRGIERMAQGKSEIEQYRYWRDLAREQVLRDPVGQLHLVFRKAMRFWVYLPQQGWVPGWKTAISAVCGLSMAAIGLLLQRRSLLMQLCTVWTLGLWFFHAMIHSELRYNFSVLPMMLLMAVNGAMLFVLHVHSAQAREVVSALNASQKNSKGSI